VIGGERLRHADSSVPHVANRYLRRRWQRLDELPQIRQLQPKAGRPRGIVQKHKELHVRQIGVQTLQAKHMIGRVPLHHRDVSGRQVLR
jgi:hypothetical protein